MSTQPPLRPAQHRWRNRLLFGCSVLLAGILAALILDALIESIKWSAAGGDDEEILFGPDNPPSPENFRPQQVVPRPPLVTGFRILTAQKADEQIDDDELVLAVEINGESRAYPLNVMNGPDREVFNDRLGGRAIAATW